MWTFRRQHYHSIMHLIASAGITYGSDLPTLPMADHKNVNQHTLNPASPSTALLLSLSGVPKSRILRPIVTYLEDHLFIGQADIREITYRFGAEEGYTWWYDFQRVEDWEKFVQDAARPRYGEVESVREDTVVLLNTGPHVRFGARRALVRTFLIRITVVQERHQHAAEEQTPGGVCSPTRLLRRHGKSRLLRSALSPHLTISIYMSGRQSHCQTQPHPSTKRRLSIHVPRPSRLP